VSSYDYWEAEVAREAYPLDSPKHPSFHERYADYADFARKRDKEGSLSEPGEPGVAPGSESDNSPTKSAPIFETGEER
jgi:hypothetical protein